jgi:hypothetical protein
MARSDYCRTAMAVPVLGQKTYTIKTALENSIVFSSISFYQGIASLCNMYVVTGFPDEL